MMMSQLVAKFVRLLREADPERTVEAYWRLEPPASLTYYVQPAAEGEEQALAIGNDFARDMRLTVIAETPWAMPEQDGPELVAAVEAVQNVCAENRQLAPGLVAVFGPVEYQFVTRDGRATPNFAASMTVTFRVPTRR
jgi:hypothetical protein